MAVKDFVEAFNKYGSDKSGFHTYEFVYDKLFKNRLAVTNILEVGIHHGASLRAWAELFPGAEIIGLDNNPANFFTDQDIISLYVDQAHTWTFDNLKRLFKDKRFDMIVDDGCHYYEETKNTFYNLIPLVKVGGVFVIEDIKEEYLAGWLEIMGSLPEEYTYDVYNMLDKATCYNDNIVIVVKRIK